MIALAQHPTRHRRRWLFIIAAIVMVVVVVAGAIAWWFTGGSEDWARSHWDPPEQARLSSSMRVQPVAGWQVDVAELGLPPGSQITNGDPLVNTPGIIVSAGTTRTYLVASSPGPTPQWWLAGIDAGDGRVLFPPVKMGATNTAPSCFLNGTSVVCIAENFDSATAWVVDGRSGTLTYTGPTEIHLITVGKLTAAQAGSYLVAAAKHHGLYGVGPKAETTWFVLGAGIAGSQNNEVAFQGNGSEDGAAMFALKDGTVIVPEFPENSEFATAEFFDGGFSGQFYPDGRPGRQFVQFFDTAGKLTSEKRIEGQLIGTTANLTTIREPDAFSIYDPDGVRLFKLPGSESHGVRLIGTTLWVSESSNIYPHYYQRYDLRTGEKGRPCPINLDYSYLGTDGEVAVRAPINPKSDMLAEAFDLATCEMAWSIPRIPGSLGRVARVGDTLVRVSDDGTEIYSLVRP